jgi:hypothetical protein
VGEVAKHKIASVVFILGQKCTLRCRDCGNFTPYLPQAFYDLEAICDDLAKLAGVAEVENCQVQGGEPLIFPELAALCTSLSPLGRGRVCFATDGTRLLTSEQLNAIRGIDASLRISDYAVSGRRAGELQRQCEQEGVRSVLYQFASGDGTWIDMGGPSRERGTPAEAQARFAQCPFNRCLTLEDGILARCSRATVAHHVQRFTPAPGDLVMVRRLTAAELFIALDDYLRHPAAMQACRYCLGNQGNRVAPAIQIRH